ncbi:MAG: phosphoesterase RecJ-like protein [Fusobacteria bacterium]|nr:MAG: phosphoesterase RecJ-like protein [Fusobacteriota bacterium]KAF0229675.1 MAG: phosphoesterase RecJ-like [Fusobacteriota bacterium]
MKEFKKYLKKLKKQPVLVVSHESPDGDAIGSSIGMGFLLKELGFEPLVINKDLVPEKYSFLENNIKIKKLDDLNQNEKLEKYLVFVMDSGKLDRIGFVLEDIFPKYVGIINIDHHISNDFFGIKNFVYPKMAATSEIVGSLFLDLIGYIPSEAATAIYTGVMTDTGNLTYESTTSATVALVSILHEMNADFNSMRKFVYENESIGQIAGVRAILNNLDYLMDGYIAYTYLNYEDILANNLTAGDIENYVDYPRKVSTSEVAILFKEFTKDEIRISIRTKSKIDANKMAAGFGGGGHKRAAGFRIKKPLNEAIKFALNKIVEGLKNNEWNN